MISRQDKLTQKQPDFVPGSGSPLSLLAAFSPPKLETMDNESIRRCSSMPGGPERASSCGHSISSSEEVESQYSTEPSRQTATSRPIEIASQSTNHMTPVGTPGSYGSGGSSDGSSSVLAKYIQKFQEEDPRGVWNGGRSRSSPNPNPGIRRHLSMPQLPSLNEEGHDHEAPQEYDSAESSAGSSTYHSTKSCPVSPHHDHIAQEEQLYLWQRRQKFSNSLTGIKVLSDFYDPNQFSPHSSSSQNRPSSASSGRYSASSFAVPTEDVSLENSIAEDRYGIKYFGKWKAMETTVRILRIKVGVDVEMDEAQQLLSEMMSALRHPNLELHVGHSPVVDTATPLMTLSEHLPHSVADLGPPLHKKNKREAMAMAHRWALELFRGMTYLHTGSPPVALCDLHPDDLHLDSDLHLKIVDVGLRTALRRRGLDSATDKISVYTAPELIAGGKAARVPAADMYSCGMVLWFLYHGLHPRRTEENRSKPSLDAIKEVEILEMVQQCWEGPDDRPSSADCIRKMELVKAREAKRETTRSGSFSMKRGMAHPKSCSIQ